MLSRTSTAALLIACLAAFALGCSSSKAATGPNLDATSTAIASTSENATVWAGATQAAEALRACKFVDDDCVHAVMQKNGGSEAAYAFFQHNGSFLTDASGSGKIRLGHVFVPWAINSNFHYVLLGGTPSVVPVAETILKALPKPFEGDPTYAAILTAGKKSEYTLWTGDEIFEAQSTAAGGGQEFVFQSALHDQCHACGIGIAARIAIDSDASGAVSSTKLLGLCQAALLTQDVLGNGTKTTFHDFTGLSVNGQTVTEPYLVTLPSLQTCPPHAAYNK